MAVDEWRPIAEWEAGEENDGTPVLLYIPESWDTDGYRVGFKSEGVWYDSEAASYSMETLYGKITHFRMIPEIKIGRKNSDE